MKVGIADREQVTVTYKVRRAEHNDIVALVEIFGGIFEFGLTVQRAILPKFSQDKLPLKKMLFIASFGSTNLDFMSGDEQHLHGHPYYVTYGNLDEATSKSLFLITTYGNSKTALANGDMGAPLWDLDTGEVVGLAAGFFQGYAAVIMVAAQRQWIDSMRTQMHSN